MDFDRDLKELDKELDSLRLQSARLSARIEGMQAERDALAAVVPRQSTEVGDRPNDSDLRRLTSGQAIVEVLRRSSPEPMRIREIIDALTSAGRYANYSTVSVGLQGLLGQNLVLRVDRGLYMANTAPGPNSLPTPPAQSRYSRLRDELRQRSEQVVHLSFSQIEEIIKAPLPPSARKYPAWWANERSGSHVHARSWLSAQRTARVNLREESVAFAKEEGADFVASQPR
jgi:hypothetical protein